MCSFCPLLSLLHSGDVDNDDGNDDDDDEDENDSDDDGQGDMMMMTILRWWLGLLFLAIYIIFLSIPIYGSFRKWMHIGESLSKTRQRDSFKRSCQTGEISK